MGRRDTFVIFEKILKLTPWLGDVFKNQQKITIQEPIVIKDYECFTSVALLSF